MLSSVHAFRFASLALVVSASLSAAITISTPASLTVSRGSQDIPLTASGGAGTLTWSVVSGSLPPGLALRTDVPAVFNSTTQQAGLIGVATTAGTSNFTVSVTDGTSTSTLPIALKITALNLNDPAPLFNAAVGSNYSYQLSATGAAGSVTYSLVSGALPPGLTLNAAGLIFGAPTSDGSYFFTVTLNDGTDSINASDNINVSSLRISTAGVLPNGAQGSAYSQTLAAVGGTGAITWSAGGFLPPGITLSGSGLLSATSITAQPAIYNFTLTATGTAGTPDTKQFSLTVTGTTPALLAINNSFTPDDATIGDRYSNFWLPCCGGVAPVSWTATGLPPGMSIRFGEGSISPNVWAGGVELWGIPTAAGTYSITLTATGNDGQSVTAVIPFRVSNLSYAAGLPAGTLGVAYSGNLRVRGGTGPYTAAPASGVQIFPGGVGIVATPLSLAGIPTESGFFNPQVVFSDAASSALTRRVGINISNIAGSTGVAINNGSDLGVTNLGTNYNFTLSGSGTGPFTWAQTGGALPPGLSLSTGGVLSGISTAGGTYTFLVRLTDSSAKTAFRQFRLVVAGISITTAGLPFGNVTAAYSATLSATGGSGAQTWTVAPGSVLPANLTLSAAGVLFGIPASTGQYNFTVQVTDTASNFGQRSYTLNIYPAGGSPPVVITTSAAISDQRIGTTQIELNATGGSGTYAWALTSGTLPPGLAVRADKPNFFSTGAQAGIIGVATTAGSYSFTLTVTSGSQTASRAFTLRIRNLRVIDVTLPDVYAGVPFSYQFTPVDGNGPVTFAATTPLPAGVTLSSSGLLFGTVSASGNTFYNYNLTDNDGPLGRGFSLSAFALRFTSALTATNGTQGAAYPGYTFTAAGGSGSYTFASSGGIPSGLTLDSTGLLRGTVSAFASPGNYSFTVTATDTSTPTANSYSRNMGITILGVPSALPRLNFGTLDDYTLGNNFSYQAGICCGGTGPYTWTVTGMPAGVAFRTNSTAPSYLPDGSVEIYGSVKTPGTYPLTLTVTDSAGSSTSALIPIVVGTMDVSSPASSNQFPSGVINTAYTFTVRVLGGTAPYTVSQPQIGTRLPSGLSISGTTRTVSGTPLENVTYFPVFVYTDATGATYKHNSAIQITGGTNTISVNAAGNYGYDLGVATLNNFYSTTFGACCVPNPYAWTVVSGGLPTGMTLSGAGVFSGTPTAAGTYFFLARATDSLNSANSGVREFKFVVSPMSITTNSLPFGNVGSAYSQALITSGGTGTVTWTFPTGTPVPPGMTLSAAGVLSGTPTSAGTYGISLLATDSATTPNTAYRNYTINIYPAGGSPPLFLSTGPNLNFQLGRGSINLTSATSGGVPPYRYAYSPAATPVPGFRVLDGIPQPVSVTAGTTGSFIGVGAAPGTYATSIRVTDSAATPNVFDRSISVTILPMTILDQSTLPKATLNTPYNGGGGFQIRAAGGTGAFTFTPTGGIPAGMTLSSGGLLSGTPTVSGSFTVSFTLANAAVTCPSTTCTSSFFMTLTVDPFAISTAPILPDATVGTNFTLTTFAATNANCGGACTWSAPFGGLPGGLTLNAGTGALTGAPTGGTLTVFTIQAQGPAGTVSKVFSQTVGSTSLSGLSISNTITTSLTVGATTALQLSAGGGTQHYTYSLASGTLPPGILLSDATHTGETLAASLNPGFYYLYGRATTPGIYNFTLQVTDGSSATATKAFTWIISELQLEYTNLPLTGSNCGTTTCAPMILNQALSPAQPMLVLGGSGSYTSWAPTAVYPGLSMNATTGTISGTPANTGSQSQIITVTDSNGKTVLQNLSINPVSSTAGPTVTLSGGPNLGTFPVGSSFNFTITPSGGTGPYTLAPVGTLPAGIILMGPTATNTNITAGGYGVQAILSAPGTYTFAVQATDSLGNIGVKTYSITIAPASSVVTFGLPDASTGAAYSQRIYSFSPAGVTFSLATGSALPPGMALSAAGLLGGTPTAAGLYVFSVNYGDATTTASTSFTLRVSGINITSPATLPVAKAGFQYNGSAGYQLTAAGGNPPYTWTVSNLPNGLTATPQGLIAGTVPSSSQRFALTVVASDGVSSVTRTLAMFVTQPNPSGFDVPISLTQMSDAIVGQSYVYSITPNGGVGPYTFAVASGSSLPPGFSLLNPPPANTSPGTLVLGGAATTAGTYTFDLVFTDAASATVTRTFKLKVSSLLLTQGNFRSGFVNSPFSLQFSATGGTPPYTYAVAATGPFQEMLTPGLTFTSAGLLSGIPTSTGNPTFAVTVTDATGASFTRNATVSTVNSPTTNAVVTTGNVVANVGTTFANLTPQANGFPSTPVWSSSTLPPGIGILNGPSPSFTGNATTAGIYSVTLRATDSTNASNFADRTVRWEISPMQLVSPLTNAGAVSVFPKGTTGTVYSFTYAVAGGTGPYTYIESPFSPLPPGITLSTAGVISGTPTQTGVFPIRPIITDSTGARLFSTTASVLITSPGGRQNLFDSGLSGPGTLSAGSYFSFALDRIPIGVPPFTWSVIGTLPAGLSIMPGSNGVPTYVAGTPTAAALGATFTLRVVDAGQTLDFPVQLDVTPMTLTPQTVANGFVGTPYSVTFVASGGTAPYSLQLAPGTTVVPGLTLSGGTLSGTPTAAGVFPLQLVLTDSAGTPRKLTRKYEITVDNAAGQAPGISLAPKPINILYIQGDPAPSVPLTVSATSGTRAFTSAVLGLPAGSLSAGTGTTPGSPSLNINTGTLGVGTYSGLVAVNSTATLYGNDATPVNLTVLAPPPCTYSLTPGSASYSGIASSGTFNISTGPACAWSSAITGTSPWLTLTGTTSGVGNGTVNYSITLNSNPAQRTGIIGAGGQTFNVTQFGSACSFAIRPISIDALPSGGTATIDVVASGSSCVWPASSGLSVVVPASPTGSAQATITIPANTNAGAQVLTGVIAGQTITINQSGAACTPVLGSPGTTMPSGGGSGSAGISGAPGCPYSTIVGPSWISITSGGSDTLPASGSANVTFSVSSNSTTSTRSGNLLVGGQSYLITQDGLACSVTLDTSALPSPFAAAGGNGSLGISANGPNCSWTAASNNTFASVSPPSGTGNGTVTVSLTSNAASATARTGSLSISGQSVNLSQAGTTCTYGLRALSSNVPATGGVGSVGVIAPGACSWTATSNAAFLTVVSGASSAGTQEVQFVVSPSSSATPQTGTLTIAGQTFTVTQGGAPCTFTLASGAITVASTGVTGSTLNYTTPLTGCPVTPISYAGWLTISNSFAGTAGTLTYTAAANPAGSNRTGNIQIGDKVFTVTQSGAACAYSLNSYGAAYNKLGGSGTVLGSPNATGCTPVTGTSQSTIIQLPPLGGPTLSIFNQDYIVNPFNSVVKAVRRATITFGGQIYTVKQSSY